MKSFGVFIDIYKYLYIYIIHSPYYILSMVWSSEAEFCKLLWFLLWFQYDKHCCHFDKKIRSFSVRKKELCAARGRPRISSGPWILLLFHPFFLFYLFIYYFFFFIYSYPYIFNMNCSNLFQFTFSHSLHVIYIYSMQNGLNLFCLLFYFICSKETEKRGVSSPKISSFKFIQWVI